MVSTNRPRLDRRLRPWVSAGALVLGACQPAGPTADLAGVVEVPPDAVHVLATLDVVTRVRDLQPTGDGRVWVLDTMAPYFLVLGPDGQVERHFGEQGGGPEEFDAPVALVRGADPSDIWTYDVPRNALIRVSTGVRRDLALPRDSIPVSSLVSFRGAGVNPAPPWLQGTRDGFLLARARVAHNESALHLWDADILLLGAEEAAPSVELYMPLADLLGDPASRYGAATIMLPYPLWTVCADGTVALYDPLANTLRHLEREAEELAVYTLPDERRMRITEDLVFDLFYRQLRDDVPSAQLPDEAEMRRLTEEQNRQFVSASAGVFPEFADLRCAADGSLWLQPFDVTTGRLGQGSDWLRFAADGSHTSISLPAGFRTFRIEGDRMWGTIQDTLGVASVAWIGFDSIS